MWWVSQSVSHVVDETVSQSWVLCESVSHSRLVGELVSQVKSCVVGESVSQSVSCCDLVSQTVSSSG